MRYKLLIILLITISSLLLISCEDRYELNEIAITSALAFDKTEEGYSVTAQVILPNEVTAVNQTNRVAVTTFQEEGKTIDESLSKLTNESSRAVYLGHLRGVVISEALAKEGIAEIINYLFRNPEVRSDFYIYIGLRNNASDFLKVLTPIEKVPANDLFSGLRTSSEKWGTSNIKDIDEIIQVLSNRGENLVLNAIVIKGNPKEGQNINNINQIETPTSIEFENLVIFYRDQMIAALNEDDSIAYNHVIGRINSTIVNVPCGDDEHFAYEITHTNIEINPIYKDNHFTIMIDYEVSGNISELPCNLKTKERDQINQIEGLIEHELKDDMYSIISKAKNEYKSDIFGFGDEIHKKYKYVWKEIKGSWNRDFKKVDVSIKIDVTINKTGNIDDSISNELK